LRYHLNIVNDGSVVADEEGEEFSSFEAARISARASVRALVENDLRGSDLVNERRIEIADPEGTILGFVSIALSES
jgi:hypothetical protein